MGREIDIRSGTDEITSIRICDIQEVGRVQADVLVSGGCFSATLRDTADGVASMHIPSKTYAQNLIKTIEKAIELGWFK